MGAESLRRTVCIAVSIVMICIGLYYEMKFDEQTLQLVEEEEI